jgi:maleate cis-trans isomerase
MYIVNGKKVRLANLKAKKVKDNNSLTAACAQRLADACLAVIRVGCLARLQGGGRDLVLQRRLRRAGLKVGSRKCAPEMVVVTDCLTQFLVASTDVGVVR